MKSTKYLWPVLKLSKKTSGRILNNKESPVFFALRKYSSENAHAQEVATAQEKIQLTKPNVVKWKRPPFLKSFFFGKFDNELLAFPEIFDKEQLYELENNVKQLQDVMHRRAKSVATSDSRTISDDSLQELKDLGLFGRMIPSKYGGLDLNYTACVRMNEVLGLDWSLYCTLAAHEFLATEAILKFGSEAQKDHYLPKLASGELIAAFCSAEKGSGCDLLSISTTAKRNVDGNYVVNGTKSWVTNAHRAGVFIVFVKSPNDIDSSMNLISAFIIDKNSKGIKIMEQNKTCLHGLDTGIVQFEDVVVPQTNLIKGIGDGFDVYFKAIENFRIAQSTFTFGTLKALVESITYRTIHTERVEESLADKQLIRKRLSKITGVIYAMESLSYFTAAILDSTENPDVSLEAIALKLFNSKGTMFCLQELMELVGSASLTEEMHLARFLSDAQGLDMFDAPNDIAKIFLSFNGIKEAGAKKHEHIVKLRNTFFFPMNTLKESIRRWRISRRNYKYDQDIAGNMHPSLVKWGNRLEEKLQLFELTVETMLSNHGNEIIFTQLDPKTLAEAATDLYAISAVLSRCSRSYCIGLKNCHHELQLATSFCFDTDFRLLLNLNSILVGASDNNETNHLMIGGQVIDCQGYFPEHPLKHNF